MEVEAKEKTGGVVCKRFFVCVRLNVRVQESTRVFDLGGLRRASHLTKKIKHKAYFSLHIPLTQWV